MAPDSTAIPKFTGERIFTAIFFVVLCAYVITAVGFAVYLAWRAYTVGIGDFEKVALGSIIAVIGTGLTACAAIYTAHRQGLVAKQIESIKKNTGAELARLTADLTKEIEAMKSQSAESLQRLGVHLNSGVVAYRELFGAAAVYYYALRSAGADEKWNDAALPKAQEGMIEATRQLLYVSKEMNDRWFHFWQEAEFIYRTAIAEEDADLCRESLRTEMARKNPQKDGKTLDFIDVFAALESAAKSSIAREVRPNGRL